jgi:alpha-D-xyloside xylohydrolase
MAAEAHETGAPMLRPMLLEFPEDRACEYLDRQYMLGDRLLVAPVFDEEGRVDYYLPEGDWYSLITDEKLEGGAWRCEKHGFMSLPLLVRGGTVLPVGKCDMSTEYDFADGVELRAYGLKEGEVYSLRIPAQDGRGFSEFTVSVENGQARVTADSGRPYSVKLYE